MPVAAVVSVDSTSWAALAVALSVLGAFLSLLAYRRRGAAAGVRGIAWTLVPIAAWLTGLLRLAGSVVDDVLTFFSRLVFSPTVWVGVVVAGVSGVLFLASGVMRAKGLGQREGGTPTKRVAKRSGKGAGAPEVSARDAAGDAPPVSGRGRKAARSQPEPDDDMAEIEAILKKHGI